MSGMIKMGVDEIAHEQAYDVDNIESLIHTNVLTREDGDIVINYIRYRKETIELLDNLEHVNHGNSRSR